MLIDYNDEPAQDALLPAGRLREPLAALSRASTLVITKIPENYDAERISTLEKFLSDYARNVPIAKSSFLASHLVSSNSVILPFSALDGNKIVAVSALAKTVDSLSSEC